MRFTLIVRTIALGALCGCAAQPIGQDMRGADAAPLYSLIDTVPGFDPASGERYDEYVRDYNLTLGDCWDALNTAKASDSVAALSCEIQPQGEIRQGR